jgi:hypothetical protein
MNNISLTELTKIFIKYPEYIITKIYYYYLKPLDYIIQQNIINFNFNKKNLLEYSIYSYVNYIPIKYKFNQ